MNIQHLKYAVEVERTRSINKAAEALFMGQPNLSRAIRELEESLGITIFARTSKGIVPTPHGEEFLSHARNIIAQIEQLEEMYNQNKPKLQAFNISVPRASYIAHAFTLLVAKLESAAAFEFNYKETNAFRCIKNIVENNYSVGIIRYDTAHEQQYLTMLKEKELRHELVLEFEYQLLMSESHPLADKEHITAADLHSFTQINHGDPYVPYMTLADARKSILQPMSEKRVFIYERGSQFELLSNVAGAFMLVSPMPKQILQRHGLILRRLDGINRTHKDILVFKKNHASCETELMFLSLLKQITSTITEV